jgi:hypothetical protein
MKPLDALAAGEPRRGSARRYRLFNNGMRCEQSESASGHDDDFSSREWSRLRRIFVRVAYRVSERYGACLCTEFCGGCLCTEFCGGCPELYGACPELYGACPELYGACPELYGACPELYGAYFLDIFLGKAKQKYFNIQVFHAPCMGKQLGDRKDEWKKVQTTEARAKNVRPRAVFK